MILYEASLHKTTGKVETTYCYKDRALYLFIKYQSLYMQYQERADAYRRSTGHNVRVYSDDVARMAKRLADEYERMLAR